jgi:hypothetical protein
MAEDVPTDRNPMRGAFLRCCASAGRVVVSRETASRQTKILPLITFVSSFQ